jgi:hypothetical protein
LAVGLEIGLRMAKHTATNLVFLLFTEKKGYKDVSGQYLSFSIVKLT